MAKTAFAFLAGACCVTANASVTPSGTCARHLADRCRSPGSNMTACAPQRRATSRIRQGTEEAAEAYQEPRSGGARVPHDEVIAAADPARARVLRGPSPGACVPLHARAARRVAHAPVPGPDPLRGRRPRGHPGAPDHAFPFLATPTRTQPTRTQPTRTQARAFGLLEVDAARDVAM